MGPSRVEWRLFLDLDGVLADFDRRIEEITGAAPQDLEIGAMWSAAASTEGFFDSLPWMPDGRLLWEATRHLTPTILTGLPRGRWAAPQKRRWCARELGPEVPVVTCMTWEKPQRAQDMLLPGQRALLVDDRARTQAPWEEAGGVFVLHQDAASSIEALRALGVLPPR